MFLISMLTCSCRVACSIYYVYQLMQVLYSQVCGNNACGPLEEGQVGRVAQPTGTGKGPHMDLGLQSYLPPISYQAC